MAEGKLTIGVNLDAQDAYDNACALIEAFTALRDSLAKNARVCTHPAGSVRAVEIGHTTHHLCVECDRILKVDR